jgi:adenylate cyclase
LRAKPRADPCSVLSIESPARPAPDEEGTVSRLCALRQQLIDAVSAANGSGVVKTTIEFGSVVDAVHCALEVQRGVTARNANIAPEKRIELRVGIHLCDVMRRAGLGYTL